MNTKVKHYINRSGWLRAAVLGANDGIISVASIIIGVAAASTTREPVLLAGAAGLVAGALSMAAGEFVSVSSQTDIEHADLEREKKELIEHPEQELNELVQIYLERGLSHDTARIVAQELTDHDALLTHARDELGIHELTRAQPYQAALSSCIAFFMGGLLPVLVAFIAPLQYMEYIQYVFAIFFLAMLGAASARAGGSSPVKSIVRVTIWGTLAMVATAGIGHLFNVNLI